MQRLLAARFGCGAAGGPLLFWQFVEAVVRVAHLQQHDPAPLAAKVTHPHPPAPARPQSWPPQGRCSDELWFLPGGVLTRAPLVALVWQVQRAIMTQLLPLASLRASPTSERVAGFLASPAGAQFMHARAELLLGSLAAGSAAITAGQVVALLQVNGWAKQAHDCASHPSHIKFLSLSVECYKVSVK